MKILILGVNALSHHLAQTLADDPAVELIYHPGSNMPIERNSYKYVPVSFEKQLYTTAKNLLTFILLTDIETLDDPLFVNPAPFQPPSEVTDHRLYNPPPKAISPLEFQ